MWKCGMVNVELFGQAVNDDSERSIWCASLSCLSRSSNQTNETDQRNQINQTDQLPATRHEMCAYKTWTHYLGAGMFIPGA